MGPIPRDTTHRIHAAGQKAGARKEEIAADFGAGGTSVVLPGIGRQNCGKSQRTFAGYQYLGERALDRGSFAGWLLQRGWLDRTGLLCIKGRDLGQGGDLAIRMDAEK